MIRSPLADSVESRDVSFANLALLEMAFQDTARTTLPERYRYSHDIRLRWD